MSTNSNKPQGAAAPAFQALEPSIELSAVLLRLRDLQAQIEAVKPLYAEADLLTLELVRVGFVSMTLADGTVASLVDNFVDAKGLPKLTAWKSCGIKRFDIDFTDEASAQRKAKRKDTKS